MFGQMPTSGLTFSKVLGGISKTLSIANQVIPLYQQAKPMINNAKTIFSVLKEFNTKNPETTKTSTTKSSIQEVSYTEKQTMPNTNSPVFFQ